MVVWSALAHAGALGLVLVSPGDHDHEPPRVISVELVEPSPATSRPAPKVAVAPPPEAAPEPAPPPEVAPEPEPPPPPKPDVVVLPEKSQTPKPKPKEKPKPKPREEVFKEPPKKQEKNLDELLAEMRGSGESKPPAPTAGEAVDTAVAPSPGPSEGSGDPLSPEEMAWHALVKRKMKGIWIVPPGFRTQPLVTRVVVSLDAEGNILGSPRVTQRSGNPWYDDSVIRGLTKASPLPKPPEAGDWPMQFEPGDSL
jgi:periplasmic protein TonB